MWSRIINSPLMLPDVGKMARTEYVDVGQNISISSVVVVAVVAVVVVAAAAAVVVEDIRDNFSWIDRRRRLATLTSDSDTYLDKFRT